MSPSFSTVLRDSLWPRLSSRKRLRILRTDLAPIAWDLLELYHDVIDFDSKLDEVPEYDVVLSLKNIPSVPQLDLSRLILFQTEPPLASKVRFAYDKSSSFYAFFCFNPYLSNHIALTRDACSYPYRPSQALFQFVGSPPQQQLDFSIYYAGKKGKSINKVLDSHGSSNIYPVRDSFVAKLIQLGIANVYGKGWDVVSSDIQATQQYHQRGFRFQKQTEISEVNPRYVLALENSILESYISEKIHDGFASDRVTLYLGAPNIESFVPSTAFVSLLPFYDQENKIIDVDKLICHLNSIDDSTYISIQESARAFRSVSLARSKYAMIDTTYRLINALESF